MAMCVNRVYRSKDGRRITIGRATCRDLDSYIKLWQALADERKYIATEHVSSEQKQRWRRSISDLRVLWAVAKIDGELVGTLTLSPYYGDLKKTRHVRNLGMGVAKDSRSKGVGNALMEYAIRWARGRGVEKIVLSVFSTNRKAIKLYEKFGFTHEGTRKKAFLIDGKYVAEVMMGRFV